MSWLGDSVGWSVIPCTKRSRAQFLVRAHTQFADSIPSRGTYRKQLINVSFWHQCFSLSFYLFPFLFLENQYCLKIYSQMRILNKSLKRVNAIWYYLLKILKNPNESLVTESRSVVTWGPMGRGGMRRLEGGIAKEYKETLGVTMCLLSGLWWWFHGCIHI